MNQQINRRTCLQAFNELAYSALILPIVEPIPYLSTEDMVNNWPVKSMVYLLMRIRNFYMLAVLLQSYLHLRSHILIAFFCITTFTGERGPPSLIIIYSL